MTSVHDEATAFAREYVNAVTNALNAVPTAAVADIVELLWQAYEADRQIFFIGNGGSAATASHLVTDLAKGALGYRGDAPARPVRAVSGENLALLTAWSNDVGFASVFLGPLRTYLRAGDAVVAISASGSSENVVRATRYAHDAGATTVGLTGFGGGALAPLCDQAIVVDSDHYGVVEDVHLQIGHIICY